MMRVLFDEDADRSLILARKVAVLGYGNQGRAQALNLRDSRVTELKVAGREGASAERARREGFDVVAVTEAASWADVVVMLAPDEDQARIYAEELAPKLREGAALVFAHGLNIHFKLIEPRPDLDIIQIGRAHV